MQKFGPILGDRITASQGQHLSLRRYHGFVEWSDPFDGTPQPEALTVTLQLQIPLAEQAGIVRNGPDFASNDLRERALVVSRSSRSRWPHAGAEVAHGLDC